MATLLNAAKYLASEYDFAPIHDDEPMFNEPIVLEEQRNLFLTLHVLACAANGTDPAYISVKRVVDWLDSKARAANA